MIFRKRKNINIIKNKGYSLIELMVVLGILSLVTIGLVTFFTGGTRSWISGQNQLKAQREARMIMDSMVKEIREGKSVVNDYPARFDSYENGVIVSFPDVLGGGDVSYELVGNSILRNGTNTLIENIPDGGLFFAYYDDEDEGVADPTQASKLKIILQVDVDGDMISGGNADVTIETEVSLRNYGIVGS